MAKYSGTLSTNEVCTLEVDGCIQILDKYDIDANDIETITDMIREAYFQLTRALRTCRHYEAYIKDEFGEEAVMKLFKILIHQEKAGENLAKELKANQAEDDAIFSILDDLDE